MFIYFQVCNCDEEIILRNIVHRGFVSRSTNPIKWISLVLIINRSFIVIVILSWLYNLYTGIILRI